MSRAASDRDQTFTPFAEVLAELCDSTASICAALVDREGETVDYAGRGDPFEIRILAAELRLLFSHFEMARLGGGTSEILVRAQKKSFLICALPEGYALVLQLPRRASGVSERPLSLALQKLCAEAGFPPPSLRGGRVGTAPPWRRVSVGEDPTQSRRPCRLETSEGMAEIEVIGRVAREPDARRGERGYRIRLSNGDEGTLVREPLGFWYLEEDP